MAESLQSYGNGLPDQVEKIGTHFDTQLELIGDIRELYSARATLEREYATKLQALTRKAAEKKAKMELNIVVGNDATKSWDAATLKSNTLNSAYDKVINTMGNTAEEHLNIADALTSQVVEVLKTVERKNGEAKKKEMLFFQKLLFDRDRAYGDRLKSKQKYDEECLEVESFRQRQSRAGDDKHADRAAKQAEQQRNDMLNSKNVYLISTAIANQVKARFYEEDLPKLENEFQSLQTRLVQRLSKILLHAQSLQITHLEALKALNTNAQIKINEIDPLRDEKLFITHNAKPFTAPIDWNFEPCAGHYDTDAMSVEPAPKIFIQNKLRKCREKLQELHPFIDSKQRDVAQLSRQVLGYIPDHKIGNIDELIDGYLEAEHQLTFYLASERVLNAEIETIVTVVGDDEGARSPHSFKSSSFSIPTQCGYCRSSIWGLSKQGKTCKACGVSVHSKCELKIPADCQTPQKHESAPLSRSSTSASTASRLGVQAMTPSPSFVKPGPSEESTVAESYPTARVLFDFSPTSEFELAVHEHAVVYVIEPDDGSGWVKISDDSGDTGLVPASYLEPMGKESSGGTYDTGPGSGQRGAWQTAWLKNLWKGVIDERLVRAIYPYQSQGSDELSLKEGDILELSSSPTGGRNYADGWWEGYDAQGVKGIFPSNYVSNGTYRRGHVGRRIEIARVQGENYLIPR